MSKQFPFCDDNCSQKLLCSLSNSGSTSKVKYLRINSSESLFKIAKEKLCEGILKHPNIATSRNWYQETPLHYVAKYSLKVLDNPKAYEVRDRTGDTPFHWAARNCDNFNAEILLNHPRVADVINYNRDTPLHILAAKITYKENLDHSGDNNLVNLFLAHPATHVVKDCRGNTPLHDLVGNYYNPFIESLKHPYINSEHCVNSQEETPMWNFATKLRYSDDTEKIKALLAHPDLTKFHNKWKNGNTVLHLLTNLLKYNTELVKLLLQHPEIKTCKNSTKSTPYKMLKAKVNTIPEVYQAFEQLGLLKQKNVEVKEETTCLA